MECWMNARLAGRTGNDGKDEVSFPIFHYSSIPLAMFKT